VNILKTAALAVGLSLIGASAYAASECCCCKDKDAKMECCDKMKGKDAAKADEGKPAAPSEHKDGHKH
jgi:hypothetical protein